MVIKVVSLSPTASGTIPRVAEAQRSTQQQSVIKETYYDGLHTLKTEGSKMESFWEFLYIICIYIKTLKF